MVPSGGGEKKAVTRTSHKAAIRAENERAILQAAEAVFAEQGFRGATTTEIARRAGVPKANLHYYFPTKEELYRRVLDDIVTVWLEAASTFDTCEDPVEALTRYIHAKMDLSRQRPLGSKVWASEVMRGAPIFQDYLETTLRDWLQTRVACIEGWIAAGKIRPVNPKYLLYMIWAVTQHYADFAHQIATLNDNQELTDAQFAEAKETVTSIILRGIGAIE